MRGNGSKRRGRIASNLRVAEFLGVLRRNDPVQDFVVYHGPRRFYREGGQLTAGGGGGVTFIPWNNGKPRDTL